MSKTDGKNGKGSKAMADVIAENPEAAKPIPITIKLLARKILQPIPGQNEARGLEVTGLEPRQVQALRMLRAAGPQRIRERAGDSYAWMVRDILSLIADQLGL